MATPLASYQIPTDREDLSDVISVLAQRETPFLDIILNGGEAATNTTHEWVNIKLSGNSGTLISNIDNVVTTITLSGESALGVPNKYVIYQVIRIGTEDMRITANPVANGSNWDLTVTRGFRGTTAAAHTAADPFKTIGRVLPENYKPTDASEHEFGSKDSNFTQIFGGQVELGATATSITVAGRDNNMAVQKDRVMTKLVKELEVAAILNGAKYADGSGDNRSFEGLSGSLAAAAQSTNVGGALTTSAIEGAVDKVYSVGGQVDLIFCSNAQKLVLNALMDAKSNSASSMQETKFQRKMDHFGTQYGMIPILQSFDVPSDTVYLLNTDFIKLVPLQSQAFSSKVQGAKGMLEEEYIQGQYTMEFRNKESHHRLHNLT